MGLHGLEGFKGGLHVYFLVRPAPVATVILNVHARLRLGVLEVGATMMSGREVFRASFGTHRDVRVSAQNQTSSPEEQFSSETNPSDKRE